MIFLNKVFMKKLDEYIRMNYEEPCYVCEEDFLHESGTGVAKKSILTEKEIIDLKSLMDEIGDSFHEKLFQLIDQSGMTDVEVYKRAGIDRKLFSKIRSNPAYHPRKNTVLALAIALKLDIKETKDLLSRAEYALSPSNKGDLLIKFFIEHEIYDIMAINFALDEYGQPILG